MKRIGFSLLVASMSLASCAKNEVVQPGSFNNPSFSSGPNGFSYFVSAQNFTLEQTVPLSFTCDSLAFSLAVTGYSSGIASVEITADSISYRTLDLTFNTNQAMTFSFGCVPKIARLRFSRFSGTLSFALGGINR
jgi:hypothetical protein